MIGVNFQPGASGNTMKPSENGVQEAIKVLSLRLPKVVGARGVAQGPLLQSQGSGGSRVDSVVNQVLSRMFPTGGQTPSNVPSFGTAPEMPGTPTFGPRKEATSISYASPFTQIPRIIVGPGPTLPTGDFSVGPDGRPMGGPGGVFGSLPGTDSGQPPATIAPFPSPYGGGSDPYHERPYEI